MRPRTLHHRRKMSASHANASRGTVMGAIVAIVVTVVTGPHAMLVVLTRPLSRQ